MMEKYKKVTEAEFQKFIASYPRKLERDVCGIGDPPLVSYNDFERAPRWPDSIVALCHAYTNMDGSGGPSGFKVLEDINSPVADDGTRDTDQPLTDKNGVVLAEGDKVSANWGMSFNYNTGLYDTKQREETILIRDRGTKYEHWSFESCHNIVRGWDMVKI